jgi:two-component system cell cycle response regulator DivK
VRKRLLIVEDDEFNRDLLVQIFEDAYDLAVAADGGAAVALAFRTAPDLILMDVALPGLNGLVATRAIRARQPLVPIVAVSSSVMPDDRKRAIDAGCDAFVAKPIDDLSLRELVNRLVERR